ncbi:MAG: NADAR family protein [Deltaproteobacteria bacterium]|nr:NADAR family protein [Deltaproteobacteria bacterium]
MEDFPEPIEARDVETLREALAGGARAQYLLFWGHTPRQAGVADKACLSQWYPSPFVVDGLTYATAEHFMMAEKARLFDDGITLAKIHEASSPAEARALGLAADDPDAQRPEAWPGQNLLGFALMEVRARLT